MLKTFPVFPLPPAACGANPNNVTLAVLSSSLYSAGVAWGSFSVDFARIGLGQGGNDGVPYNYFVDDLSITTADATTPLPAALPLFAGGLGVMGLLARRRKRKAVAALAAA